MSALYWDLHALRQCHAKGLLLCDCPDACFALYLAMILACIEVVSEVLLRGRPDACFVLHCVSTEAILVFAGSPRCVFRILFYKHLGNVMLTNCLCGIAQMRVGYCVSQTLKQYQADDLLLWERPDVCFASFEAMSGQ